MSGHTELPWEVYSDEHGIAGDAPGIESAGGESIVVFGDLGGDFQGVRGETPEEALANARFIVRACNAHYDLLEALKEAVEWDSHDSGCIPAVWFTKARTALSKAQQDDRA